MPIPALLLVFLALAQPAPPVSDDGPAALRGVVVDAAGGSPLSDVIIRVDGGPAEVRTGLDGRFEFPDVAPGRHELFVSRVGYALARRVIDVPAGRRLDLVVPLAEGTRAYTEEVVVEAHGEGTPEAAIPSRGLLSSGDLQDVRGVLADDPLRAVQALPGVVTGDDFRSEFSVRGGSFRSLGVVMDGFAVPLLVHTVRGVDDTGSVAILNSDLLDGLALSLGSYPQRFGNRTGAELSVALREGSRTREQVRAAVSGTSASIVAEGPLTGGATGSWLAGIRKSYLDWIVERIDPQAGGTIGFIDGQVKLVVDTSASSRLEWLLVGGRAHIADRDSEGPSVSGFSEAFNRAVMTGLTWRSAMTPSLLVTQRASAASTRYHNENGYGASLVRGSEWSAGARTEVMWTASPRLLVEAGGSVEHVRADQARRAYAWSGTGLVQHRLTTFDGQATTAGAFVLARVAWPHVAVTPGVRVDHHSRLNEAAASPWVQAKWTPRPGLAVRGGAGIYRQAPDLAQMAFAWPELSLDREDATHADAGVDLALGATTRLQVTAWVRRDRSLIREVGDEYFLYEDRLVEPLENPRYWNGLEGTARGVEAVVRRGRRDQLSGWIGYGWSRTPYRDVITGESFAGDFDQRHTVSVHARYAWSPRTAVNAKLRIGSNLPIAGYYEQRDGSYYVTDRRNLERLPAYARLDLRANRTYNFRRTRMTLFLEVLNATARDNRGPADGFVDRRTRSARGLTEDLLPFLPSAGVLVEF